MLAKRLNVLTSPLSFLVLGFFANALGMLRARRLNRCSANIFSRLASTSTNIIALDFDGVICASSGESSYSAIVAAQSYWPSIFKSISSADFEIVKGDLQAVRPIVETGYENMLLARFFYHSLQKGFKVTPDEILSTWSAKVRDDLLTEYSTNKEDMIAAFGSTRDQLIQHDLDGWIGMNKIYPCVFDALSGYDFKKSNGHIVTTKQKRFVEAILSANGLPSPPPRKIFDLDNPFGSKPKVLQAITAGYIFENPEATAIPVIHFVEDRYETLLAVANTPGLDHVKLYLVDWGYNTEIQRKEAANHQRIKLIGGQEFKSILHSASS